MNSLNQTFKKIEYAPRPGLAADIIAKIREREHAIGRRRFWLFAGLGALSLALLVPAAIFLGNQFAQSGFFEYLSLAASPGIGAARSELVSTIASALPVTGILAVLAALLGFAWSMRKAFVSPNASFA